MKKLHILTFSEYDRRWPYAWEITMCEIHKVPQSREDFDAIYDFMDAFIEAKTGEPGKCQRPEYRGYTKEPENFVLGFIGLN